MKAHESQRNLAVIPDTYELFWQALNAVEAEHANETDILDVIETIRETLHENQGREMEIANVRQYRVWFVLAEIGRQLTVRAEEGIIPRTWLKR